MTTKSGDVAGLFQALLDTAWFGIITDAPSRPTPPAEPTPFTAWTDCPKCGEIACHWLDQPRRVTQQQLDTYASMANRKVVSGHEVQVWSGEGVQKLRDYYLPPPPCDETFTIARICVKCGHRWGQI